MLCITQFSTAENAPREYRLLIPERYPKITVIYSLIFTDKRNNIILF